MIRYTTFSFARVCCGALICAGLAGCGGAPSARHEMTGHAPPASNVGVGQWGGQVRSTQRSSPVNGRANRPKGGGYYKVGNPYQIKNKWYTPSEQPNYDEVGYASWYGADFDGKQTANGEVYDMGAITAAHKTLPMPSYAYVTNLSNNRTVLVRVNDRGPYKSGRIIDLSERVSRELGFKHHGLAKVRVRYAGRAPVNGDDRRERAFLAQQSWHRHAAR